MRCFLIALSLLAAFASCKKDLIHPSRITRLDIHTTDRLNRIRFINDTLGVCVGGARFDHGTILITRDGGNTWSLLQLPEAKKELFGITQSPDGQVYLIGFEGEIFRSADGGRTWTFKQTRYEAYKAMAFSDPAHAQCVGGISFDRGDLMSLDTSGTIFSHDSVGYEMADIYLNAATGAGLRCGYGVMQYTVDTGKHWSWSALSSDFFNTIHTRDGIRAWTCGAEGSIAATEDGGKSWDLRRKGADLTHPKYRLQDILSTDNFVQGYAVGEDGLVIYTDDAARHWSQLEHFTDTHLHGIARCPNGDLLVCGENGELWRISL